MPVTRRTAQSLLEAIIAIGVIMTATLSATTLTVTTITAGQTSEDKILAANLAREGVEIVRGIRDSNWMKTDQNIVDGPAAVIWDDSGVQGDRYTGLGDVGSTDGFLAIYDQDAGWYLCPRLNSYLGAPASPPAPMLTASVYCGDDQRVYLVTCGSQQFYSQVPPTAGNLLSYQPCKTGQELKPTNFNRLITVAKRSETLAGVAGPVEYLEVTSTVSWSGHGTRTLTMTERLYNWR